MGDIETRRTVHGGDDSALCVEVSAWRREGNGFCGGRCVLEQADGVGVYLRNPLAMHLQDFEPGVGTIEQASAAAFVWADALAEHLGCKVDSALPRQPVPAAPLYDAETLCEVAACLWEAVQDMHNPSPVGAPADPVAVALHREFESQGTSAVRAMACGWATECETAWRALSGDERDLLPFDWEFVPRFVRAKIERGLTAQEMSGFGGAA
ncbi:MAG: hypothetical protein V4521_02150 [Pseudomonadota bacterium]